MLSRQCSFMRKRLVRKGSYSLMFLGVIVAFISFVKAEPAFFKKRAEGWHWYENFSKKEEKAKKRENQKGAHEKHFPPPHTPTKMIEEQRKALETKLHAAIIEPTHENITSYLLAQRALMNQSQRFAEAWKRVLFVDPYLDETIAHPTDQNARHIYFDLKNTEREKKIKALSQAYGLFFFFKKECRYCHGFSPIVKAFSHKYGWEVLAISLDGGTLPEFPKAKRDNGISRKLNIQHVPALIALNPETQKILPLAYGMVSQSEIEERIEILTSLSHSKAYQGANK